MKHLIVLFSALVMAVVPLVAVQTTNTNYFFVTTFSDGRYPDEVEASRNAKESRSADDDLEGNWGTVSEGFQLSVRFDKPVYAFGESITAMIVLRNVSVEDLQYHELLGLGRDFKMLVVNEQGRALADLAEHSRGKIRRQTLFKGTQHRFEVNLERRFDLRAPGEHVISVTRQVPEQASRIMTEQLMTNLITAADGNTNREVIKLKIPVYSDAYREVVSGNAIIRITDPLAPAGQIRSFQNAVIERPSEELLANAREHQTKLSPKHSADLAKGGQLMGSQSERSGANASRLETAVWKSRNVIFGSLVLLLLLALLTGLAYSFHRSRHQKPAGQR